MRLTDRQRGILGYVRRNYQCWIDEINTMSESRAIRYDVDKVQTSPEDKMLDMAIRIEKLQERVDKVDRCLQRVYVTDGRVRVMRMAFCYGQRVDDNEYHRTKAIFADALLEEFKRR